MRAVIHFTDQQEYALQRVTEREHISRNEAVRRAVERCYGSGGGTVPREELFNRMIGLWRGRQVDADAYVTAIRDEWDRDTAPASGASAPKRKGTAKG